MIAKTETFDTFVDLTACQTIVHWLIYMLSYTTRSHQPSFVNNSHLGLSNNCDCDWIFGKIPSRIPLFIYKLPIKEMKIKTAKTCFSDLINF